MEEIKEFKLLISTQLQIVLNLYGPLKSALSKVQLKELQMVQLAYDALNVDIKGTSGKSSIFVLAQQTVTDIRLN